MASAMKSASPRVYFGWKPPPSLGVRALGPLITTEPSSSQTRKMPAVSTTLTNGFALRTSGFADIVGAPLRGGGVMPNDPMKPNLMLLVWAAFGLILGLGAILVSWRL